MAWAVDEKLPRGSAQPMVSAVAPSTLAARELAGLSCVGVRVIIYELADLDCFIDLLCQISTCISEKKDFAPTHSWQLPSSLTE